MSGIGIPSYIEILTIRSVDLLQIKRLVRGAHPTNCTLHTSSQKLQYTVD